jgi:hypothetical protein
MFAPVAPVAAIKANSMPHKGSVGMKDSKKPLV